jgi:hypothetical protein
LTDGKGFAAGAGVGVAFFPDFGAAKAAPVAVAISTANNPEIPRRHRRLVEIRLQLMTRS